MYYFLYTASSGQNECIASLCSPYLRSLERSRRSLARSGWSLAPLSGGRSLDRSSRSRGRSLEWSSRSLIRSGWSQPKFFRSVGPSLGRSMEVSLWKSFINSVVDPDPYSYALWIHDVCNGNRIWIHT